MERTDRRVLVALSGGVDSSVCVQLLRQQGYEVEALVLRFSDAHEKAVSDAKVAAHTRSRVPHRRGLRRAV